MQNGRSGHNEYDDDYVVFFDSYLQPWRSKFVSVAFAFIHFYRSVRLYKVDLEFAR